MPSDATMGPAVRQEATLPAILIVEDEADFRGGLTDILESRGYECWSVGTIHEAVELLRSHPPSLCLLDLRLPDGSGLDLLTHIRELVPTAETIILTGYASTPTAVKALNLGAFNYLEKPYNIDRLVLTLEKALEHQRLVQTVRNSETAYAQLLVATGAAIFTLHPTTWRISNPNPAFGELLGYSEDDILLPLSGTAAEPGPTGLDMSRLLPDSERATVIELLSKLVQQRPGQTRTMTFEAPLLRRDGGRRWFSINATRIPHTFRPAQGPDSGPPPHSPDLDLLMICNDISITRSAVTELEQTKDFINDVFENFLYGVVIVDSEYRIIDANPAYCKPLRVERRSLRSRRCHEVFGRHANPCSMFGELCPITAARTTGTLGRVYREHRLPDGLVRNLEYTANPLQDKHGVTTRFVVVVNDLTDLRETGERLAQAKVQLEALNIELRNRQEELKAKAQRLEQTNVELVRLSSAKSDFVATVSHELRTPLTALAEGVALVEDGSLGELNSDQRKFLRLASQNTKRLADLINDLLDLSKIEAGRMELTPRRLDLNRVVRDVIAAQALTAQGRGLVLKAELGPALPPVLADEHSVHRILVNLVGNALKFTLSGGTVTIREMRSNEFVTLVVEDTGIGIPKDQQHRLFGRFEQIANNSGVHTTGTGLGLALSRQLVEMNQGRIWVESDEGKGARFFFTLPIYDEFVHFRRNLGRFSSVAKSDGRAAAIYLFEVSPKIGTPPEAGSVPIFPFAVMGQLADLLAGLFPPPSVVSLIGSRCAAVVLAPRKLPEDRFRNVLDSMRGASLFVQDCEVRVKLRCSVLDYRPDLLAAPESSGVQELKSSGVEEFRSSTPQLPNSQTPQLLGAEEYDRLRQMMEPMFEEIR